MVTIADKIRIKPATQAIQEIRAKLTEASHEQGAAYSLIVGAGFSFGVVPLTENLLHEHIGDYYFDNQSDVVRSVAQKRRLSASYWKLYNAVGHACGEPVVDLEKGLPAKVTEAYQSLFSYRTANALFAQDVGTRRRSYLAEMERQRRPAQATSRSRVMAGEQFVKDFLLYVVDPGGYRTRRGGATDYCTTGRNDLNGAHFFLASLLELQQAGELWNMRPFCRTIFTTNFDTMLQNALQQVNILYRLTDRPERGMDLADFPKDEPIIHLVYTHGSILRHNQASTTDELAALNQMNARCLGHYLESRDVLVLGYGGWNDTLMSALAQCDEKKHRIYWCNMFPEDACVEKLASVRPLFEKYGEAAAYVPLGPTGADGFMARLYQALAPTAGVPTLLREPLREFRKRIARVRLDKVILTGDKPTPAVPGALPAPRLEMAATLAHGAACRVVETSREILLGPGSPSADAIDGDRSSAWGSAWAEAHALMLLVEGFARAQAGDRDAAERIWSRVLRLPDAPSDGRARAANYLGIIRAQAGRNDLAIPAYDEAIGLAHESSALRAEALTNRGVANQQAANLAAAVEDFSRAIALGRDHPRGVSAALVARALTYRGLTHEMNSDLSRARHDIAQALMLKDLPGDCQALLSSKMLPGPEK